MKEATCPRQRTVISSRVGLGSHGIFVLQAVEYKCQANSLWSRKNVKIWLGERLPRLHGSVLFYQHSTLW
jgi:hypothetical protein